MALEKGWITALVSRDYCCCGDGGISCSTPQMCTLESQIIRHLQEKEVGGHDGRWLVDLERGGDHVTRRDQLMVDSETRGMARVSCGGGWLTLRVTGGGDRLCVSRVVRYDNVLLLRQSVKGRYMPTRWMTRLSSAGNWGGDERRWQGLLTTFSLESTMPRVMSTWILLLQ